MLKKILFCFLCLVNLNAQNLQPEWVKQYGGSAEDTVFNLEKDNEGNFIMIGYFTGTSDFDASVNDYILSTPSTTNQDIFVSKYTANGDLIWAKRIGGINQESADKIIIDSNNNIIISGIFNGNNTTDFDPGIGVFNLTPSDTQSTFVLKLNSSGDFLNACKLEKAYINDLSVDSLNNIYYTGRFGGVIDVDPGAGIVNITSNTPSNNNSFLIKINENFNFQWVKTFVADAGSNSATSIYIKNNEILLAGFFQNTVNFDYGNSNSSLTRTGSNWGSFCDAFILKLDLQGNFNWVKQLKSNCILIEDIAFDNQNNICVTGFFYDNVDLDTSVNQLILNVDGLADLFLAKYDTYGNLIFGKKIGENLSMDGESNGKSLAIDSDNNLFVVCDFQNKIFFNNQYYGINYTNGISILSWDAMGNELGCYYYPAADSYCYKILNVNNAFYTTGYFFNSVNFGNNVTPIVKNSYGDSDNFLFKLSKNNLENEDFDSNNIKIYPNPVVDFLSLDLKEKTKINIKIFDINSRLVFEKSFVEETIKLDFSKFNNGVYLVECEDENNGKTHFKIMK